MSRAIENGRLWLCLALPLLSALLEPPPASASCQEPRILTTNTFEAQSYLYTPGQPFTPKAVEGVTPKGGTTTYYLRGSFWAFGQGDPKVGHGVDNGRFLGIGPDAIPFSESAALISWLRPMYFPEKALFGSSYGHWQFPGIDGCISHTGSDPIKPDAEECLVVMLSDFTESAGHFAALSTPAVAGDFLFTETSGFPKKIELGSVPVPRIVSSRREGTKVKVEVGLDAGATEFGKRGLYLRCHANEIVKGYRLYARRFPSSGKPPTGLGSRALDVARMPKLAKRPPWQSVTTAPVALGKIAQVSVECSPGEDIVLAATLTFGGSAPDAAGFELFYVSADSERVSCSGARAGGRKAP